MSDASYDCDVLVIGAGGAGLAAAVTAGVEGLRTLVVEKDAKFGGTTATSGGTSWIAESPHAKREGIPDTVADARTYLEACIEKYGSRFDADRIDTYLANGPAMVEFMESRTRMRWAGVAYFPDYHPELSGHNDKARALNPAEYDARKLPRDVRRNLKWPWTKITFAGLQVSAASKEQHHFYHASRSPRSALYVGWLLAKQARDVALYGRSRRLVNGNAVVAMLAASCHDAGVPIWVSSPAIELIKDGGRVRGAIVERAGRRLRVHAARGVVLASGGFEWNRTMWQGLVGVPFDGALSPPYNEGDGLRAAARVGAQLGNIDQVWWMPALAIPGETYDGRPRLRSAAHRGLPGSIIVNRRGRRYGNESMNYNDFGKLQVAFDPHAYDFVNAPSFQVFDQAHLDRYPILDWDRETPVDGWLVSAPTLRALAEKIGVDPDGLEEQVREFNRHAEGGRDPAFHRGEVGWERKVYSWERYRVDDPFGPSNPTLAPLAQPPFHAYQVRIGCFGTKGGTVIDEHAAVVDFDDRPIPGLYAAGNVTAGVFGPAYPGGGSTLGPAVTFGYLAGQALTA